jgi:hypothetical protein
MRKFAGGFAAEESFTLGQSFFWGLSEFPKGFTLTQ